ncbi:Ubiquitin carboxyl-terminal hydrolase 26 [Chamberlinius hualienensis]
MDSHHIGECFGEAIITSSTKDTRRILGYLEMVKRRSGIWVMILGTCIAKLTYKLTSSVLNDLSEHFCEHNRLQIKFSNDDILDFTVTISYLDKFATIINKLKKLKERAKLSTNVHDKPTTDAKCHGVAVICSSKGPRRVLGYLEVVNNSGSWMVVFQCGDCKVTYNLTSTVLRNLPRTFWENNRLRIEFPKDDVLEFRAMSTSFKKLVAIAKKLQQLQDETKVSNNVHVTDTIENTQNPVTNNKEKDLPFDNFNDDAVQNSSKNNNQNNINRNVPDEEENENLNLAIEAGLKKSNEPRPSKQTNQVDNSRILKQQSSNVFEEEDENLNLAKEASLKKCNQQCPSTQRPSNEQHPSNQQRPSLQTNQVDNSRILKRQSLNVFEIIPRHTTDEKCYGYAKISSSIKGTRRIIGYLEVEKNNSGTWMVVLISNHNKITYELTFAVLSNLPDSFCENDRLRIKFSDDDILDFKARSPNDLVAIGKKIQQLKDDTIVLKSKLLENEQNRHKPLTNDLKNDNKNRKTIEGVDISLKTHQNSIFFKVCSTPQNSIFSKVCSTPIPSRINGSGSSYLTSMKENVSANHSFAARKPDHQIFQWIQASNEDNTGTVEPKTHPPSQSYLSYISPSNSGKSLGDNNPNSRFHLNLNTVKRPIQPVPERTAKKSRLSQDINNNDNDGDQAVRLPLGFPNLGNTCYMNSILQALYMAIYNCNKCESMFMNCYNQLVNKLNSQQLFKYFGQIMEIRKEPTTENSEIKQLLTSFKQSLAKGNKIFQGNRMQDAHEFLSTLFYLITESTAVERVIDSYFRFTLITSTKCNECSDECSIHESRYDCGVNILDKEKTLKSSLHLEFTCEIERDCKNCNCNKSTQTSQFLKLPRILIIYVKRYSGSSKIETKLEVPKFLSLDQLAVDSASLSTLVELNWNVPDEEEDEDLERAKEASLQGKAMLIKLKEVLIKFSDGFSEYKQQHLSNQSSGIVSEHNDQPLSHKTNKSYRLISYVCHTGYSTNTGHYVAYTYDCKQKKYFSVNDAQVQVISEDHFINTACRAYILMYIHKLSLGDNNPNSRFHLNLDTVKRLSQDVNDNDGDQPVRFPNLGNTCYMNSILQALHKH